MRTNTSLLMGLILGLSAAGWAGDAAAPAAANGKTRVLIVTGGHDFEREPFFAMFKANPEIVFEAIEHPKAHARWASDAARAYDVIVLYDLWQPIAEEAKADFLARIKEGKGIVALHHCLASYQAWPEYGRIVGGKYHLEKRVENGVEKPASTYKHDVPFRVRVAAPEHPVTAGLKDFDIHDETYGMLEVDPGSQALLRTDEATSHPVIGWAREEGRARVVYLQLGHDHMAYENPSYRQLVAQAIRWAARKPAATDPQPEPWLRERLEWFQDLKFGFMMHWGAYSQWGCMESWPLVEEDKWARPDDLAAWNERNRDIERFKRDYVALPRTFNPIRFDPRRWARAAKDAGTKYVVFTTKHHDGFSMFDTRLSDYRITAPDVPFHTHTRSNVVREVFQAFRREGFGIGAYFSKADWHSPDYWRPEAPARTRNPNYDPRAQPDRWARFVRFTHGQVEELMTGYGPIDILWLDAGQVRPPDQDLDMDRLAAMARRHQPGLIVVDRTVGGRYENYRTPEQEVPEKPLPYVWESCMTLGDQWSFKPNDNYKSASRLVHLLVDIVAKGGNLLLNVGPQPDGELPPVAVGRMREVGDWLRVNGKAIHGTRAIAPYKDGAVAFTRRGPDTYALFLPKAGEGLPATVSWSALPPAAASQVRMLGAHRTLRWHTDPSGRTVVEIPEALRQSPPCQHAYAFHFQR